MTNETTEQNKARPLDVIAEMGKTTGRAIGGGLLVAADWITAPLKIPTDERRLFQNEESKTAGNLIKVGYGFVTASFGELLAIAIAGDYESKPAQYVAAGILATNALSGAYEILRHAYKKTEGKLNAR